MDAAAALRQCRAAHRRKRNRTVRRPWGMVVVLGALAALEGVEEGRPAVSRWPALAPPQLRDVPSSGARTPRPRQPSRNPHRATRNRWDLDPLPVTVSVGRLRA